MFKESSLLFNPETHSVINGCQLEDYIINSIYRNIDILSKFETPYPFFISISLLNVKNCRIDNGVIYATGFNGNLIPENDLILPSIYIENNIDIPGKLACCFEVLWNASGYAKSLNNTQEPSHAQEN